MSQIVLHFCDIEKRFLSQKILLICDIERSLRYLHGFNSQKDHVFVNCDQIDHSVI